MVMEYEVVSVGEPTKEPVPKLRLSLPVGVRLPRVTVSENVPVTFSVKVFVGSNVGVRDSVDEMSSDMVRVSVIWSVGVEDNDALPEISIVVVLETSMVVVSVLFTEIDVVLVTSEVMDMSVTVIVFVVVSSSVAVKLVVNEEDSVNVLDSSLVYDTVIV